MYSYEADDSLDVEDSNNWEWGPKNQDLKTKLKVINHAKIDKGDLQKWVEYDPGDPPSPAVPFAFAEYSSNPPNTAGAAGWWYDPDFDMILICTLLTSKFIVK